MRLQTAFSALVFLAVGLGLATGAAAQPRFLGLGGFGTNDRLGDEMDRWRTGSYELTLAYGQPWDGRLPTAPSAVLGVRVRGEVISPYPIEATGPDQRLYAGVLAVGVQGFASLQTADLRAGADLVLLGPQTRLDNLQRLIHKADDGGNPPPESEQLGNAVAPTAFLELGRSFGRFARVRPFVEAQAGYESFARVGFDATLGRFGQGGLMTRDVLSGERYPIIATPARRALSLTAGADVAVVANSRLFPSARGPDVRRYRPRARVGAALDAGPAWAFFGLTWLGREFEGASGGQRVGTITFNVRF